MARAKRGIAKPKAHDTDAGDGTEAEHEDVETSTHEHWDSVAKLAPLAPGRCRCTSIEHEKGEPGCEASEAE